VTPTRNREFFPLSNVGFRDVPDPLARYSDRYAAVPGPIGVRQLPVQPLVHLSGSYPSEAACFAALTGGPRPPRRQVFFSFRFHTQVNPPIRGVEGIHLTAIGQKGRGFSPGMERPPPAGRH
jgi:hypothetical protein